jgi:OFA family oxalate/formate antiporter-like MFS transporter
MADKVPGRAWVVTFAGTAVNLCLGILYAWSVWAKALINEKMAGQVMTGMNAGWVFLTNSEAADPFMICIIIFTILMIPGGKIQDKFGPKVGAITGGLCLALGCIIAGLTKSYTGLIIGFGIFGGIGMGIGYAAPTPAALKWFGAHKRGLVAGLVVGGYGGAALYVAPLGAHLIEVGGLTYSFVFLGILFGVVTIIAGSLLSWPEPGYVPPAAPVKAGVAPAKRAGTVVDWAPSEALKTWQLWALVLMFIGTAQSGLMVISIAAPLLAGAAKAVPFLLANAWILPCFGGAVNASGRVGTGFYSDKIGRSNAYALNCIVSAILLFLMPTIVGAKSIFFLFVAVFIAYWQYGGGLSLMPSFTADFFGPKNLGMNYGLVFLGWGGGFFMAKIAGIVKDAYGTYDLAFYMSGVVLIIAVILSRITKRPLHVQER